MNERTYKQADREKLDFLLNNKMHLLGKLVECLFNKRRDCIFKYDVANLKSKSNSLDKA